MVTDDDVEAACRAYRDAYPDGTSRAGQQGMRAALMADRTRMAADDRESGADDLEQRLWAIIDRNGLADVPSDICGAVAHLKRLAESAPPAPAASPACGGEVALERGDGKGGWTVAPHVLEEIRKDAGEWADEAYLETVEAIALATEQRLHSLASPEQGEVVQEIAAERQRQIDAEGWAPEHDDKHCRGEMLLAAISYAMNGAVYAQMRAAGVAPDTIAAASATAPMPSTWPWATEWWKPKNPRRNLVRAAALIVAEIERLDRAPKFGGDHVK